MSLGVISTKSVHLGTVFTDLTGDIWLLCDGSAYPRATYPALSAIWPSGSYASTSTNIHLPDLNNIALRNYDVFGTRDVNLQTRVSLSGVLPIGSGLGAFQASTMQIHVHTDSPTYADGVKRSQNTSCPQLILSSFVTQATIASGYSPSRNTAVLVSGTTAEATTLPCTNVYYYICAT